MERSKKSRLTIFLCVCSKRISTALSKNFSLRNNFKIKKELHGFMAKSIPYSVDRKNPKNLKLKTEIYTLLVLLNAKISLRVFLHL
jgi:hypothetical protein